MARSIPFNIASTDTPAVSTAVASRPGLLRRLFDALLESQQRRAEREITNYLHRGGIKFTDDVEREIERRFLGRSSERW